MSAVVDTYSNFSNIFLSSAFIWEYWVSI